MEEQEGSAGEPQVETGRGAWPARLRLAAAVLLGAAAVGVAWLVLGRGGTAAEASFQVSPGIPPVVFLYLDNVQIASYLAQLQGGAATSEVLSRQSSQTRNASVGSNGVGVGASATQQSTAELSLTVNDQSRFTNLLGLLQSEGFLHSIDMSARDRVVRRQFAAVPDGAFVKLSACALTLPNYVQYEQAWRAAKGHIGIPNLITGQGPADLELAVRNTAMVDRAKAEGDKTPPPLVGAPAPLRLPKVRLARARKELDHLVRRVGTNPRVLLSSCSPLGYDPHAPDLLMPIRLGEFTANETALAGRVTLVAKVMLAIRGSNYYVDQASLRQWSGADFWTQGRLTQGQLQDDATVLAPGYVLQPIAIYK